MQRLENACDELSSLNKCVPTSSGKRPLWFDSCKRPPPVSDHEVFAFWAVTYGMFDCIKIEIDIEEIWMVLTILTDNEYYLWLWSSVTVVPFYRFWLILVHIRHYSLLRWIQWVRPIWFTCFFKTSWYLRAVAIFFCGEMRSNEDFQSERGRRLKSLAGWLVGAIRLP